jgi:hypothetical protein
VACSGRSGDPNNVEQLATASGGGPVTVVVTDVTTVHVILERA